MSTVTQADIDRWRANGASEEQIAIWIRNARRHTSEVGTVLNRMVIAHNRMRGVAPGTPADAEPLVIDGNYVDVVDRVSDTDDGGPVCTTCGNKRWVFVNEQLTACPKCRAATVDVWRASAAFDGRYSSADGRAVEQTFEAFDCTGKHRTVIEAYRAAHKFAEEPRGWLTIYGTPGTGKTHLLAAIANAAPIQATFTTHVRLADSLKALFDQRTVDEEAETFNDRKQAYMDAPLLILDDIGAGTITQWSMKLLYDILDARYRKRLPTVLASNLDMTTTTPQGDITLDARIVERWSERGFGTLVRVSAPSHRMQSTTGRDA